MNLQFTLVLVSLFLVMGCLTTITNNQSALSTDQTPPAILESSVDPTNPSLGNTVIVRITAEDETGLEKILLESSVPLENGSFGSFDCSNQTTCTAMWELVPLQEGTNTLIIYAKDSAGNQSIKTRYVLTIGPQRETTVVCGNGVCESTESFGSCSQDCQTITGCANGICDPGESYLSCPQDCGPVDGIGRVCGDGACESGEDAQECAQDCQTINPSCGNSICGAGETESNCSADCEPIIPDGGCSSDEDCDYGQVCNGGQCYDVECTTDSQCGSCERCSSNSCVSCGSGPYGCYC